MTIKEVEQLLEVPRATVRFYEKEGLVRPQRESNGYRDYSEADVDRLKKIIVLRKIGLSVTDIEDLFDSVKSMDTVLEENIHTLRIQIEEMTGAMNLCSKMKADAVEMDSLDIEKYWNYVEEEEQKGHRFADLAKDFLQEEKKTIFGLFGWADRDGNLYSWKAPILSVIAATIFYCLLKGEWSAGNVLEILRTLGEMICVEVILFIPIYFLGKKFPWIAQHKQRSMMIALWLAPAVLLICIFISFCIQLLH